MWRWAGHLLIAALVALCLPIQPATIEATTDDVAVTLLGDSTMAAMSVEDVVVAAAGRPVTFDARSCRRLVAPSCRGADGVVPVSVLALMEGPDAGQLGDTLVIMAGYDDVSIGSAVDAIVEEALCQGAREVIWLTYRTNTSYRLPGGAPAAALYSGHNAALLAAAAGHPQLTVADWDGHSWDHAEWFAADGIHLTRAGARALARFVADALVGGADVADDQVARATTPARRVGTSAI